MSEPFPLPDLGRRSVLLGALGLGAGAALSACTSNTPAGARRHGRRRPHRGRQRRRPGPR